MFERRTPQTVSAVPVERIGLAHACLVVTFVVGRGSLSHEEAVLGTVGLSIGSELSSCSLSAAELGLPSRAKSQLLPASSIKTP